MVKKFNYLHEQVWVTVGVVDVVVVAAAAVVAAATIELEFFAAAVAVAAVVVVIDKNAPSMLLSVAHVLSVL